MFANQAIGVPQVHQPKIEVVPVQPHEVFQWHSPAWGWLFLGLACGFLLQLILGRWRGQ